MRFRVSSPARCSGVRGISGVKRHEYVAKDDHIQADTQEAAVKAFKEKHRLCEKCPSHGTPITVEFYGPIVCEAILTRSYTVRIGVAL